MNRILYLIFLILVNSSCGDCKEIEDYEGLILIYDELNCHSCLSKAKAFTDSIVNDSHQEYILYLINQVSKRKIELEFREYSPNLIIQENDNPLECLKQYPRVSLVFKNGSEFSLVKNFTSN